MKHGPVAPSYFAPDAEAVLAALRNDDTATAAWRAEELSHCATDKGCLYVGALAERLARLLRMHRPHDYLAAMFVLADLMEGILAHDDRCVPLLRGKTS